MRIFAILFFLIFISNCATRNIRYDRNKILKKYSDKYSIFIDDQKMDLQTIYLDKDNIKNVRLDKKVKEIKIKQFKSPEFFELKELDLDSLSRGRRLWYRKKIELIVIDGILINDSLKEKLKLDINSIKSVAIVSKEKMNLTFCKDFDGDLLVINTK